MKSVEKKKPENSVEKWINLDKDLTQKEIIKGIRLAEEGPFHSVQESMEHFESWLKESEKK